MKFSEKSKGIHDFEHFEGSVYDLLKQDLWSIWVKNHHIDHAHIKIFIILIKLIFQNNIFNKICGIFLIFFGDMATFAVEVWSWKLCQIKDPLAFGAAIRGSGNQNIALV